MPVASNPIPFLTERNKRNFFEKVSTTPNDRGCLEWIACRDTGGYGQIKIGNRNFLSHRIAYFIATGSDPRELLVCHHCDNRKCCNPEHFFLDTNAGNMRDMANKGRAHRAIGDSNGSRTKPESHPRGDRHGQSKLTEEKVIAIRLDSRSLRKIAADYGVHNTIISDVKRRKTWKHVK